MLLRPVLHRETTVTLLDWERAPTADDAKTEEGEQRSRREIREGVKLSDAEWLGTTDLRSEQALAALERLSRFLDAQLVAASPSLSKLADVIASLRQAAQSLLKEIPPPVDTLQMERSAATDIASVPGITHPPASRIEEQSGTPTAGAEISLSTATIKDREQAYAALMSIAVYLQRIEPHSPTPYLIQRAIELGQLSLPEMIRDVSASAGSLDKFFELLGITPPG